MNEAVQQPNQNLDYRMSNAVVSNKRVYMRSKDMADVEKEIETSRLQAENAAKNPTQDNNQPSEPVSNPENPTSANKSDPSVDWETRYKNLQSDRDKKLADANKIIATKDKEKLELETKLKETEKSKTRYPTSEEELAAWCKEYPPLLPIIQTIALKAYEGSNEELVRDINDLKEFKKAVANERGRTELLKIHPDADDIEKDPRFAQWYNEQEPEIQALIPASGGDPKKIAKAISLYKKDFGIVTKTAQDKQKEASKSINLGPTPPDLPKEQATWYESQVAKMTEKQYARYEHDIELARAEGRYIYDISRA